MILTQKQIEELNEASKPLMAWLTANCNPHCKVIVENDRAEAVEGLAAIIAEWPLPKSANARTQRRGAKVVLVETETRSPRPL